VWLARHEIPLLTFHAVAERSTVAQRRDTGISSATGGYAVTASLPAYALIPLPGEGPEDVVAGPEGVIYTGLLDGRVVAVAPEDGAVREVANTGGRPLGLEATADGRLLICDSPKGLLELNQDRRAHAACHTRRWGATHLLQQRRGRVRRRSFLHRVVDALRRA
jgi:streptogramin lyase